MTTRVILGLKVGAILVRTRSWRVLWTQRHQREHATVGPLQAIERSLPAVSHCSTEVLARNYVMLLSKPASKHAIMMSLSFYLHVRTEALKRRTGAH